MGVWSLVAWAGVSLLAVGLATLVPFWVHARGRLSPGELRVFGAYAEALVADSDGVEVPSVPLVLDAVERMVVATSPTARLVVCHAAWLFEWLPIALLVGPRRFSRASLDQRRAVLRRGGHSGSLALGALFEVMTFPVANALAGTAEGQAVAGIDRPARIAECRSARQAVVRRSAGGHR